MCKAQIKTLYKFVIFTFVFTGSCSDITHSEADIQLTNSPQDNSNIEENTQELQTRDSQIIESEEELSQSTMINSSDDIVGVWLFTRYVDPYSLSGQDGYMFDPDPVEEWKNLINIVFESDGRLSFLAECNTGNGTYFIDENGIVKAELASLSTDCDVRWIGTLFEYEVAGWSQEERISYINQNGLYLPIWETYFDFLVGNEERLQTLIGYDLVQAKNLDENVSDLMGEVGWYADVDGVLTRWTYSKDGFYAIQSLDAGSEKRVEWSAWRLDNRFTNAGEVFWGLNRFNQVVMWQKESYVGSPLYLYRGNDFYQVADEGGAVFIPIRSGIFVEEGFRYLVNENTLEIFLPDGGSLVYERFENNE